MNILEMLQSQMGPQVLEQLGKQIGVEDPRQVQAASNGIAQTLLASLSRNAASPSGLNALVSALDRDHDGSILNDLMGFVTGAMQSSNTATTNGSGILGHILGNLQPNVLDMVARMSGLDKTKVSQLATTLAPVLLGLLGQQRQQAGLNVGGIGDLLKRSMQTASTQQPSMGLLNKFLDRNGDGSVIDDIARMGMEAFLKK
ncbi:MAG: DUF937 domain-containing protein [Saprospiraceae bacterium]